MQKKIYHYPIYIYLSIKPNVRKFTFKGNKFTDRVAKMLAEVLKVNRFIEELDLSYNEFREAGSLYLGAGLVSPL